MNLRDHLVSNKPWEVWQDWTLLLIRILSGLGMYSLHGVRKWNRLFTSEGPIDFADPIFLGPEITLYLAIFSEVICALLLVFGFRTRIVVLPLIATMLVIIFRVHWSDTLADQESPVLYLLLFLILLVWGGGKYSVDHWFGKKTEA